MAEARRVGWRLAAMSVGVGAVVVVSLAASSHDNAAPVAPATSTSTTTTAEPSTSTTPRAAIDPLVTDIATAVGAEVEVFAVPPPDAVLSPQATVDGDARRVGFAGRSPERAGAPDLPALGSPIQGRHRTESGWRFGNPTPWGNPLTFVVTEDHGAWLRVEMPVRPNGTEGWVRAADVTRSQTTARIVIDVSDRRLQAFDRDTVIADTAVVVGKDSTRTPTGRAYVTDIETKPPAGAYGPYLLALNVYSQDLDLFGGGVPVIAIHGTNRPDLLGSAASNGCIRIPNDVITLLRDVVPLGTPVDILA